MSDPIRPNIPKHYTVNTEQGSVRCSICKNARWIQYDSIVRHERTKAHRDALEQNSEAIELERVEQERMSALYSFSHSDPLPNYEPGIVERPRLDTASNPSAMLIAPDNDMNALAQLYVDNQMALEDNVTAEDRTAAHELAIQELTTRLALQAVVDGGDVDDATVSSSSRHESLIMSKSDLAELQQAVNTDWSPYPSKELFFLDLLDNLPRLRLSDAHMDMILWVMRQCDPDSIPSLSTLRRWQVKLQRDCGVPTERHVSSLGNIFYSNDIRSTIAMDFAKPYVAPYINEYPELDAPAVSEVWQAGRWKEFSLEALTPMYVSGSEHFYVQELAQLDDGNFVVPVLWFLRHGTLKALVRRCTVVKDNIIHVHSSRMHEIDTTCLRVPFPALIESGKLPGFDESSEAYRSEMPNPLRKLANGRPLFSVFLNIWADDVSGNVSKQYNKHNNIYVANMSIPGRLLQQEAFVHFFSTSPDAGSLEQLSAIKAQMMETLTHPHLAYHAARGYEIMFRLYPFSLPADNPQQSDECSHMGALASLNCRACKNCRTRPSTDAPNGNPTDTADTADGPSEPNDWYARNYKPGELRSAQDTVHAIDQQIQLAARGEKTKLAASYTETGIKDPITQFWITQLLEKAKELRKMHKNRAVDDIASELLTWLDSQPGEKYNPLLNWPGLNPHADTPVEILHTILLGVVKYVWHGFHTPFGSGSSSKLDLFATRLQSVDTQGLTTPAIRASYICQYRNNLIGKHFKTLSQVAVFHVQDLCSPEYFRLWKATALLCPVLWYDTIKDMTKYIADLRVLIDNVLAAYAAIDPLRILNKVKLHVITHIPDNIPRFGPGVRYATEVFECFNAIFRMCSVLSNHIAPSRDIAESLAGMSRVKHYLLGGYVWSTSDGQWVQASHKIQRVILEHQIVQTHIGWAPPPIISPGRIEQFSKNKRILRTFLDSEIASLQVHPVESIPLTCDSTWEVARGVEAANGDLCRESGWIVFEDNPGSQFGRISTILYSMDANIPSVVVVRIYSVGSTLHPEYDMPVLVPCTPNLRIIDAKSILFAFNAQHDCSLAKCSASGTRVLQQEREMSQRTVPSWVHTSADCFIINLAAFHNAAAIREVLPRELWAPRPVWPNRAQALADISKIALDALSERSEETKKKAAATRAKNKARKAQEIIAGDTSARAAKRRRTEEDHEFEDVVD